MIFVIDDNFEMAECVKLAIEKLGKEVKIFSNGIEAMNKIEQVMPEMIFLDILLTGPDGFTFLNEIVSYSDTSEIPIVIITALNLTNVDLRNYGVVGILNKEIMTPAEVQAYVKRYTK